MRRRLGRFLPIVMLAMLVQIFAPVAACLAFSTATADPLAGAICSHAPDPGSPQASFPQDRENDPQHHGGAGAEHDGLLLLRGGQRARRQCDDDGVVAGQDDVDPDDLHQADPEIGIAQELH